MAADFSTVERVAALYFSFATRRFPKGYATLEIDGVDLITIDHETAGLISRYLNRNGQLAANELAMLDVSFEGLTIVLQGLADDADDEARDYFDHLYEMVKLILAVPPS